MKVQVFLIRLSDKHLEGDTQSINEFIELVEVKKVMGEFSIGETEKWSILVFYEDQKAKSISTIGNKISYPKDTELTDLENEIFEALKEWRSDKATDLGIPAYMVCSNAELVGIVKMKPENTQDLLKIKGFGENKISKIGSDIIAILNSF